MEVQAKIIEIFPEQRGQGKNREWVNYSFLAETEGDYPKKMFFEVKSQERWDKMKQYIAVGKSLKISFDISSREWNGRYFTSLVAFSVYGGGNGGGQNPAQQAQAPTQTNNGDVPF